MGVLLGANVGVGGGVGVWVGGGGYREMNKKVCGQTPFFVTVCGKGPCIEPGKPVRALQTTDCR